MSDKARQEATLIACEFMHHWTFSGAKYPVGRKLADRLHEVLAERDRRIEKLEARVTEECQAYNDTLKERDHFKQQLAEAVRLINDAARQFRAYEQMHLAKHEGTWKANANADVARTYETFLSTLEAKGKPKCLTSRDALALVLAGLSPAAQERLHAKLLWYRPAGMRTEVCAIATSEWTMHLLTLDPRDLARAIAEALDNPCPSEYK